MPALPATLTIKNAHAATAALREQIGTGSGAIAVDASALTAFDTSAIAALLELRRQAQAAGRTMTVSGAPAAMVELAGLYGVAELLAFEPAHSARA